MKRNLLIIFIFLLNTLVFSQSLENKGYIGDLGWYYKDGGTVLNGKKFYYVADSYREQKGYFTTAFCEQSCWMYDTYTYHNGDGRKLFDTYIPEFFDKYGYYVIWDNSEDLEVVNESLKELMKSRNCDIAVFPMLGIWVVINYDREKKTWWKKSFRTYSYY